MRCLTAAWIAVLFVLPVVGQEQKDPPSAERIAKDGVRVGDAVFLIHGRELIGNREIPAVQITLRLVAADAGKRINFTNWTHSGTAALVDDLGNTYLFTARESSGPRFAVVYSDRPATAVLIFDRPVPKAKELTLELSGENVHHDAKVNLTLKRGKAGEWLIVKPAPKKKP